MPEFKGNPEHLEIVKQGPDSINAWRMEHLIDSLSLRGANLSGLDLSYAGLQDADISNADLDRVKLIGTNLEGADLHGTILNRADLRYADFTGADLSNVYLCDADLREANLINANLKEVNFTGANLQDACLHCANLVLAVFSGAELNHTDLSGANLSGANFSGISYRVTNTRSVSLDVAYIISADLSGADLSTANLHRVNFSGIDFNDANLKEAILSGTIFGQTNLSKTKNLETCKHLSPSVIDFHTLQRSGPLPISFLKGCGLPHEFISDLNKFHGETYSSIFISYSRKDEDFVNKLQYDLEKVGISCYRDIDHLRGGREWEEQISNAIEQNDRFLLIGSENSMYNPNVEAETFKAIEIGKKRRVLFPITLIPRDTLKKWNTPLPNGEGYIANSIFKFQIPSFENWQDENTYQQSLQNLIRDLKKAPPQNT